jgi:serine/threonine protein kinase
MCLADFLGANVLVTEEGGVQLCDFGVAGIVENKVDKRSTVIGTPHWMAPELFGPNPIYGKEVDIWAFGAMIFEIATGLPPHVADGIGFDRLATYVQNHTPRLEGGNFSNEIRDLVAYCLEELPSARPTIEEVQKHPYIYNTSTEYPTSMLSQLVRAFRLWEDHGGSRKSLFMAGGAQGPSANSAADDEWNFSTTAAFDQEVLRQSTPQDVFEAYGKGVALQGFFAEETSRPTQKPSRRRPPPEALARLPAPLEKIFDPNTMSNYEENSRSHYGKGPQQPASDLPLRDVTSQTSIRDTMIDLGGHDSDTGLSSFPDMDTIKANRRGVREEEEDDYSTTLHNFSRPALSDPADVNPNRRTQDWKFPTMAPPASADPEISRFPTSYELPRPAVTPASGGRPALIHHPTEPIGAAFVGSLSQNTSMDRLSMRESLIDLDMSMPDPVPSYIRPSTANSDAGSATSEQMTLGNPFEFERHASLYVDAPLSSEETALTEPDFFPEDSAVPARLRSNSAIRTDINEISDFSGASDVESGQDRNGYSDSDMPPPPLHAQVPFPHPANQPYTFAHFPDLPPPPSARAFSGEATHEEMKDEFNRLLGGMTAQLESFRNVYSSPQVTQRMGPNPNRRDRKDGFGAAGAPNG